MASKKTHNEFADQIYKLKEETGDSLFDCIIAYCETYDIPLIEVQPFIKSKLKDDIEKECKELKMVV